MPATADDEDDLSQEPDKMLLSDVKLCYDVKHQITGNSTIFNANSWLTYTYVNDIYSISLFMFTRTKRKCTNLDLVFETEFQTNIKFWIQVKIGYSLQSTHYRTQNTVFDTKIL